MEIVSDVLRVFAVFEDCGMSARDDLNVAKPRNSLADVIEILAGVRDDDITRIDLGKTSRDFRSYVCDGFGGPG